MVDTSWKLVWEGKLYCVYVGASALGSEINSDVYLIYNKEFALVEAETSSLPRALLNAKASEATVKALKEDDLNSEELHVYQQALDNMEIGDADPN